MASLWERMFGRKGPTSAELARERLKLVLVADRSDLSPDKLEQMQAEIIQVIKRYLKIDDAQVHIKLEQRARETYLVADIPIARDPSHYAMPGLPPPSEARTGTAESAGDTQPKKPASAPGSEQA